VAGMELDFFIDRHSELDWKPGSVDCLLTLADWFVFRSFPDAAAHLRGTYCDEAGFRAIVARQGGAVATVEPCAAVIGLQRIETPRAGSIGVIGSVSNTNRQFGAIYDGSRWLTRADKGFLPLIAKPLAIWDAV
jgi:hypothetical protein